LRRSFLPSRDNLKLVNRQEIGSEGAINLDGNAAETLEGFIKVTPTCDFEQRFKTRSRTGSMEMRYESLSSR
jgi:hypothetical protein